MRILDCISAQRGNPSVNRADNGAKFVRMAMLNWAYRHGITARLIEPVKRNQNAYVEAFKGRFRDESLNEHWFINIAYSRAIIEVRRRECRHHIDGSINAAHLEI